MELQRLGIFATINEHAGELCVCVRVLDGNSNFTGVVARILVAVITATIFFSPALIHVTKHDLYSE